MTSEQDTSTGISNRELLELERERTAYLARYFEKVVNSLSAAVILTDEDLFVTEVNDDARIFFALGEGDVEGQPISSLIDHPKIKEIVEGDSVKNLDGFQDEIVIIQDGKMLTFLLSISLLTFENGDIEGAVWVAKDLSERKRLEQQLNQAQKLESVGGLAAGVAHEINTPIQYIRDNLSFLNQEFQNLSQFVGALKESIETSSESKLQEAYKKKAAEIDLDYLLGEMPLAITQTKEGADAVAKIVQSLKDFSHPGAEDPVTVDINAALETTVTVSKSEWKYIADIELNLSSESPQANGHPGELNQVFLNIIVNAAQALKESLEGNSEGESSRKGKIVITTRSTRDGVEITISDNGPGVPKELRDRIFEPFFTTKDVGAGTGQGLHLCYRTIVERHGGVLEYRDSPLGGAEFYIRLPALG